MNIGIDLGGTNVAGGLVNREGTMLYSYSVPTEAALGYEKVIENIVAVCKHLVDQAVEDKCLGGEDLKGEPMALKGIGIGVPGLADDHTGIVYECVNLFWKEPHDLRGDLQKHFQVPVHISNDATVAAVAEYSLGALKGCTNGVLITLGTGIGGGFIIQGKPFSGSHGVGSEIGHMVVGENDYTCNCGRKGCLETFSSATALIKHAQKLLGSGRKSPWLDSQGIASADLAAKHVMDGAKAGDPLCKETFDRMIHHLAVGIINTVVFIDPDIIALGGGVAKAGDFLREALLDEMEKHRVFRAAPSFELTFAQMGNDAGIIGAAMLCLE